MMLDKVRTALLFVLVVAIVAPSLVVIRLMLDPLTAPPPPNKTPAPIETKPAGVRPSDDSQDALEQWRHLEVVPSAPEEGDEPLQNLLMDAPSKLQPNMIIDAPPTDFHDDLLLKRDAEIGWDSETLVLPKDVESPQQR